MRDLVAAGMLLGCAASHPLASEAGDVVRSADEGPAHVIWSIPEEEQPPLLDGAAGVLTSAALSTFDAQVGRLLSGSPAVYEGTLLLDRSERLDVMATFIKWPSLYLDGVTFDDGVYTLDLHAGSSTARARAWQDAGWPGWANMPPEDLPASGRVPGWIEVMMPDASAPPLRGRCVDCMTVLRDEPVDAVALSANNIDPENAASVPFHVDAELHHIAPEALSPEILGRLWVALGDPEGAALADDFVEVSPGIWEREQVSQTYLRCKEGGSRLVDYRTTWRVQEGEPERSGIGDIEVFGAAACEAFDYGSGS